MLKRTSIKTKEHNGNLLRKLRRNKRMNPEKLFQFPLGSGTWDNFGKDEFKERCPTSPVELTYLVNWSLDELWRS